VRTSIEGGFVDQHSGMLTTGMRAGTMPRYSSAGGALCMYNYPNGVTFHTPTEFGLVPFCRRIATRPMARLGVSYNTFPHGTLNVVRLSHHTPLQTVPRSCRCLNLSCGLDFVSVVVVVAACGAPSLLEMRAKFNHPLLLLLEHAPMQRLYTWLRVCRADSLAGQLLLLHEQPAFPLVRSLLTTTQRSC
jgi:hypothetical protein